MAGIPQEIARLPKATQAMIKAQCGGDWARVTIDSNGAITVHNRPQRKAPIKHTTSTPKAAAPKPVARPTVRAEPPAPPPPPPPPAPAVRRAAATPIKAVARRTVAKPVKVLPTRSPAKPRKVLPEAPRPEPVQRTARDAEMLETIRADRRVAKPVKDVEAKPEPVAKAAPTPATPPAPRAPVQPAPPPAPAEPEPTPTPAPTPPAIKRTELPAVRPPWDRSHIPRTPIRPPRREAPPVEHLPRPVTPREEVRLYAAPLTNDDTDEVVDALARREMHDASGRKWIYLPGIETGVDWDGADLEGGAVKVQRAVINGLPDHAPLLFHDDVTALMGIDLDEVESAVRRPQRVEIAPETGLKKYPVLKFWRGDVMTVVGFREPQLPKIIAAYIGGLGLHNQGNTSNAGGSGGGGARKVQGLPSNSKQLVNRLIGLGADVTESPDGNTHTVIFRGQDLGKVNTSPSANRKDVENAWQRMRRRMEAIRTREDAPMR